MGATKNLLFDSDALFFVAEFDHETADVVLVAQEELIEYMLEHSDTVAYDTEDTVNVVGVGQLSGGSHIPVDEIYALTIDFIKEECGPAQAKGR